MLEIYGYSTDLRSMTGGSGEFSYEFARYEQAPNDIQAERDRGHAQARLTVLTNKQRYFLRAE